MRFTRFAALSCAAAMVFAAVPAGAVTALPVWAEEAETSGTCGENMTWVYDESTGTLTISGTGEMVGFYENGPWCSLPFKTLVVEEGVTFISGMAFAYCEQLTAVKLPDSLKSLGVEAFIYCKALEEVTIPRGVSKLYNMTFLGCKALSSVTVLNPDCELLEEGLMGRYPVFGNERIDGQWVVTSTFHGYEGSTLQAYTEKYGYKFESLGAIPELMTGDIDGDDAVTASDAADLLIDLAKVGAGEESGLTERQRNALDVNSDGAINAGDAADMLQYAAFIGAGGSGTIRDFLTS